MKLKRIFLKSIEDWSLTRPLSIVGATGSGKTSTLLSYLRKNSVDALLVSLDSVSAYKELDIGSSKPLGKDFSDFDWCGLSFASPTIAMNASLMRDEVLPRVQEAIKAKRPIVFIGGTHFYERFILEGAAPGAASDPEFLKILEEKGREKVHKELSQLDARWGTFLHINDEYRIFRYGDLVLRQGLDYATLRGGSNAPLFPELESLVLDSDKELLEPKLKKRIQEMLGAGWIEETKNLISKYGTDIPALKTIGYAEILEFLTKEEPLDLRQLSDLILIRHRQLAKQQRTWLKKLQALGE